MTKLKSYLYLPCLLAFLLAGNLEEVLCQDEQLYTVENHPDLVRSYSRFSNISVVFTKGIKIQVRRRSGNYEGILRVACSFTGPDTSSDKTITLGIVEVEPAKPQDIGKHYVGMNDHVIINNSIRTSYQRSPFSSGTRFKNGGESYHMVKDYHYLLTLAQLVQFSKSDLIEIANREGIIEIDKEAAQSVIPLLRWLDENTAPKKPVKPVSKKLSTGKKKKPLAVY
jgi:hypothetical protein